MTKHKSKWFDKNTKNYVLILTLVVLSISFIYAAGVSTPYWSTNPLKLQPGESTIISLGLQNMVGTDNITLRASIAKGSDIATIVDKNLDYFVPIGTDDVTVNIEVKIPENAEIDKTKDIEISFMQVATEDQGGFFSLASAFTQRIPVLIVGEPTESVVYGQQKETNITNWIIFAFLILGIIVVTVLINKRRK